jgi:hypothetical protein
MIVTTGSQSSLLDGAGHKSTQQKRNDLIKDIVERSSALQGTLDRESKPIKIEHRYKVSKRNESIRDLKALAESLRNDEDLKQLT